MKENTAKGKKPFFVTACALECGAVILLLAVLLAIKYLNPELFSEIYDFYTKKIVFSVG